MDFTGAFDRRVPLLMHFLLIPLDDPAHAGEILSRFLQARELCQVARPALPLALGTNEISDARDAQALARRVLTAVAENLPVRTCDLAEIEAMAHKHDYRLGYTHAHLTVSDVGGELARLTDAVLPQDVFLARDSRPMQGLLTDVFHELKYALGSHVPFVICAECRAIHPNDRYSPHICLPKPMRSDVMQITGPGPAFYDLSSEMIDDEEKTTIVALAARAMTATSATASPGQRFGQQAMAAGGVHYSEIGTQASDDVKPPQPGEPPIPVQQPSSLTAAATDERGTHYPGATHRK